MTNPQMWITLGVAALLAGASIIAWLVVDRRKSAGHYGRCPELLCGHAKYGHGRAGCIARVTLPSGAEARCKCARPFGEPR